MSRMVRYQLCIAAVAAAIFFTNLGAAALFDMDEALYTTCAREMLDRGNLVVPWFNGAMFPEKPVLMFWTMIGGFELFGVDELGARFFSAVFGVGTALLAFHLGRIFFNLRVGLWAGLITATTIVFTISARAATVDSALTFFTTLAFLMFAMGWKKGLGCRGQGPGPDGVKRTSANQQSTISNQQFPLPYAVATYACVGIAVLGKGPVGTLLPLAAMGLFLLAAKKVSGTVSATQPKGRSRKLYPSPFSPNCWRSLFHSAWWMRPLTMIVVIAIVAVPWYVAVGLQTNWQWPKQFFLEFNLRPFQKPIQGHGDAAALLVSILYYFYQIPAVLVGFFPWSVFLAPTLIDAWRRLRRPSPTQPLAASQASRLSVNLPQNAPAYHVALERAGILLSLCWFATWFLFWSICKTKLPHYLLPAYPALALLTACFVDRWLAMEKGSELFSAGRPTAQPRSSQITVSPSFPPWTFRNAWISLILVGAGIVIAVPFIAAKFLPGEGPLGLLGLLLVFGGGWCWWKTSRGLHRDAAITFFITAASFLIAVFGLAVLRVDRFQNAKSMMAAICANEANSVGKNGARVSSSHPRSPIATYRFFRWSTVFYAGKPVKECDDDPAARQSAEQALAHFLAAPGRSYVITTDEHAAELKQKNEFSDRLKEIHRERRFLADGEMVVFRHGD